MARKTAKEKEIEWLLDSAIAESLFMGAIGTNPIYSADTIEQNLLHVLKLDPANMEAINLLAQVYAQTKRHAKALQYYKKIFIIKISKKDVLEVTLKLTETYEQIKEYKNAIQIYEMALSKINNARLYNGLGYCWAKLSIFDKALHYSQRAVDLEPNNAVYVNDLGYTYLENGDIQKAQQIFLKALKIDPNYDLATANLKHCRRKMNEEKGRKKCDASEITKRN
jgi:tetratricopeptide (TPR) repeat protein